MAPLTRKAVPTTALSSKEAVALEPVEYRRMREYEERYWWHVARRDMLREFLLAGMAPSDSRLGLDLGCGTGANFGWLSPFGRFFGSEVSNELYRPGLPRPSRPVFLSRGEALPHLEGTFDLVTFFDVLEHIEDHAGFLREVRRILKPGGFIFLSVPAYPFLWSEHDVSLHHKRRYLDSTLKQVVEESGFEIVRQSYAMAAVFPLIAGWRILSKLLPRSGPASASYVWTPGPLNDILIGVLGLEGKLLRRGRLPFGTSLFCLARNTRRTEHEGRR